MSQSKREYLLKHYGSQTKHKKKKKKKKKSHKKTQNPNNRNNNTNNIIIKNDNNDDNIIQHISDGSGWSTVNNSNPVQLQSRKRQRHDTDSDSDDDDIVINRNPKRQKRQRHDTSDDEDDDNHNDSDSDIEVNRNSTNISYDNDTDSDIDVRTNNNKNVKEENQTIFRDKSGKKISLIEYEKQYKLKNRRNFNNDHDQMEWSSGLIQKYKQFEDSVQLQRQKYQTMSIYKDDAEMNTIAQNKYKIDDPLNKMKGYNNNKHKNKNIKLNAMNNRPMYKGKPWPNRYGILPGYRWDGRDRSNGFEGKKLLHQSQQKDHKKKAYKLANSDM